MLGGGANDSKKAGDAVSPGPAEGYLLYRTVKGGVGPDNRGYTHVHTWNRTAAAPQYRDFPIPSL